MTPQHRSPAPDPTLAHRTADATVTVRGADGRPLADTEVVVEQTRHAIAFGNIGFDFIGYANGESEATPDSPFGGAPPALGDRLSQLYVDLYNTATLPF
jgi:endo-1,4-beta-xylanase